MQDIFVAKIFNCQTTSSLKEDVSRYPGREPFEDAAAGDDDNEGVTLIWFW